MQGNVAIFFSLQKEMLQVRVSGYAAHSPHHFGVLSLVLKREKRGRERERDSTRGLSSKGLINGNMEHLVATSAVHS